MQKKEIIRIVVSPKSNSNFVYHDVDIDMTIADLKKKLPQLDYHFIDTVEKKQQPTWKNIYTVLQDKKTLRSCGITKDTTLFYSYLRNGSKDQPSGRTIPNCQKVKYRGIH